METERSKISKCSSIDRDRISELPDGLIHHIFSFLDIKEVIQTCMLSRRLGYLWVSLPTLRISNLSCTRGKHGFDSFNRFINFVDRLLFLRDNSDIHTLKLHWEIVNACPKQSEYDVSSRLASWIMASAKHNLQELNLCIWQKRMIQLPVCLFSCKSLTKLEFSGRGRDLTQFVLPNAKMYSFPRLRYLTLSRVSVVGDENLTSKFFSSCPVLESLRLIDCNVKFDFNSHSLKHFELDSCYTYASTDNYSNNVKLSAPNLTSFTCMDYMSLDCSLKNLSSLVTAEFGMMVEHSKLCKPETPNFFSQLATEIKELYGARMIKFLRAVSNVTNLTLSLSPGFLEVVSESLDLLDDPNFQFCNLRFLNVLTWVSRNCLNAITYLVKISPNIKSISLMMEETEFNSNNTGCDWIVGSSFPYLHYLKFVEINGIQGCLNELKFLQVLLKKAIVLEQVTLIYYKTNSSDDRGAQLMEFKEMLLAFPSAS